MKELFDSELWFKSCYSHIPFLRPKTEPLACTQFFHPRDHIRSAAATMSSTKNVPLPAPIEATEAQKMIMSQLRKSIQDAIDARGRRYERVFCFAIRFERDNTNATADSLIFQGICQLLNMLGLRRLCSGTKVLCALVRRSQT